MNLVVICNNCGESWFSSTEIQESLDISEIRPSCYSEDYLTQARGVAENEESI